MTHTSITPEMIEAAEEAYMPFGDMGLAIQCALAAAPQPPEAAQLDDTNVVDMAQAVDSKEAAPVQLPDACGRVSVDEDGDSEVTWRGGFPPDDRTLLYTEQQVRQLLAAHGIKEQST